MRRLCLTLAGVALLAGSGVTAADAASSLGRTPIVAAAPAAVVHADWVWRHGHRYWRRPPPHRYYRNGRWYNR